ncbi:MAG: FtsQ-type POTRA domain-containing protein [Oscillospiraceae bacterium]|nr:FtsQ-type POTRA domain-containing protein [Oscillospiraceae bacterium]
MGRLISFLVVALALFLGISVFFRVGEIRVEGDSRYTAAQVISASGVEEGAHLFFLNFAMIEQEILKGLPYVGHVEFRRQFPSTLEIRVRDTIPMALIQVEGDYLVIDRYGKILERAQSPPTMRLITVEGLAEPILPRPGEILYLGEEGRYELRYLQDILRTFSTLGLGPRVSMIDLTELHDPTFLFEERFLVRLGPNRQLNQKMDMLVGVVDFLGEEESGTIDLNNADRPIFSSEQIGASSAEAGE